MNKRPRQRQSGATRHWVLILVGAIVGTLIYFATRPGGGHFDLSDPGSLIPRIEETFDLDFGGQTKAVYGAQPIRSESVVLRIDVNETGLEALMRSIGERAKFFALGTTEEPHFLFHRFEW
jgi:hypothetical protein